MKIRLMLDPKTTEKLIESATEELRPIPDQAEVLLRRVLGTWNPDRTFIDIEPIKLRNEEEK